MVEATANSVELTRVQAALIAAVSELHSTRMAAAEELEQRAAEMRGHALAELKRALKGVGEEHGIEGGIPLHADVVRESDGAVYARWTDSEE